LTTKKSLHIIFNTKTIKQFCTDSILFSYYYNYYIRLRAFFQYNLGKLAPERQTILDFTKATDDGVAVASAGPYANELHLAQERQ